MTISPLVESNKYYLIRDLTVSVRMLMSQIELEDDIDLEMEYRAGVQRLADCIMMLRRLHPDVVSMLNSVITE